MKVSPAGSSDNGRRVPLNRTFASFRNYNYRLFWFGQLISQIGTWMQRIGQAWLVLQISHSATALGTVTAFQFTPILLLALFAGVIVDRFPRHGMVVLTQSLALVQSLILALLTFSGHVQLWEIYALAAFLGLVTAFDNPTRQAFVVELVGRENLVNAVGLNSAQFNGARLLGPAIGGLIIAAWGVAVCFLVNAASFLAVLLGLLMMHKDQFHQASGRANRSERILRQFGEGMRFVFGNPETVAVVAVLGIIGCFGYNFNVVMPLLAQQAFHAGADAFGMLMAAIGLGSVIAAFAVATVGRSSQRNLLIAGVVYGSLMLAVAFTPWFALAVVLLVILGYAGLIFTTSANTILQLLSPDRLRGRVMGLYTLLFAGTTPIGALFTGYLASAIGIRRTLAIEAALCLGAGLAGMIYRGVNPALRHPLQPAQPI